MVRQCILGKGKNVFTFQISYEKTKRHRHVRLISPFVTTLYVCKKRFFFLTLYEKSFRKRIQYWKSRTTDDHLLKQKQMIEKKL